MLDQAAILLRSAWQKTRHVDESNDRNIEAVAEPDEPRCLPRRVAVEDAGKHHWLVRHESHRRSLDPPEATDDILGEASLNLEEVALVHRLEDQLLDVIGLVGICRHQRIQ